jgi:hypothetical protein
MQYIYAYETTASAPASQFQNFLEKKYFIGQRPIPVFVVVYPGKLPTLWRQMRKLKQESI